jgi:hypothetical protein
MWIRVHNSKPPKTHVHLIRRIALSPVSGTFPPRPRARSRSSRRQGRVTSSTPHDPSYLVASA